MRRIPSLLLLSLLVACGQPEAPKEEAPAAPACSLGFDTLGGKTFVRQVKDPATKDYKDDPLARMQFFKEGDALKVKYTVRSLADVYTYTCVQTESDITCFEDNPKAGDWCRTLIANDKECTAEEVAKLTGLSLEDAKKGTDEVLAEVEKLKKKSPKELEDMKQVFNQPNNQLRGVLHAKVWAEDCRLTVNDRYQTMTFGQLREMENVVGAGRFVESNKTYVFEHCKDNSNVVALSAPGASAKPGETTVDWGVGQSIPFAYVGPETKAEAGCSYSMDTFAEYEPKGTNIVVAPDEKGNLNYNFQATFSTPGPHVVHMYRYKACNGGAPERIGVHCQVVRTK